MEVADVFRAHGAAWCAANKGHVSLGQLRAISAIKACRTAALGGHVARCEGWAGADTRRIGHGHSSELSVAAGPHVHYDCSLAKRATAIAVSHSASEINSGSVARSMA